MDENNFDDDNCWGTEDPGSFNDRGFRNELYSNAYGDYRGGYGSAPFNLGPPGPPGPPRPPGPPFYRMRGMGPRGPQPMGPPMTILGRGFGPGGPSKIRAKGESSAIRYLVRCGVPKHTLKNLPNHVLDLMEPQFCGLCGMNFDSYALSRVHYVSKNHQKAQTKFLSNPRSGGVSQEAPLRARELYCELCDVQITSKVHADSHYKGKSHHSVVLGRKNPKNPALLQPGMERRLNQLIRREKRILNKAVESADDEVEVKDVKPLAPELYCDICKTNVTCTEQMTAHLNGKKHLLKEKNYILRSMRGEIPLCKTENVDDDDETPETAAEDAAQSIKDEEEWQEHWE